MRTRVYLGILILLAFVSLLALPAHAQFTTITATDIQAGDGSPLAAGSMCWLGTNNAGTAIGYRAGTSGQTITAPVCRDIVSGAVATTYKGVAKGALQVADTTLTQPANVCYKVTVTDTSSGKVVLGSYAGAKSGYDCVQPSGTTWSFDTYTPAGTPGTLVTSGPIGSTGPTGPQGAPGTTTATGVNGDFLVPGKLTVDGTFSAPTPSYRRPQFPLMVDTYDFFRGAVPAAPTGTGTTDTNMAAGWTNHQGQVTITGAAGSGSATVNSIDVGALADYGGAPWALVLQHDDGTYGTYTVTAITSTSISFYPTLRAAVTAKPAWNLFNEISGQHLTPKGYVALAWWASQQTKRYSYIDQIAARSYCDETGTQVGSAWTAVGGLTNGGWVAGGTGIPQGLFQCDTRNLNGFYVAAPTNADATNLYGTQHATMFGDSVAGHGIGLSADLDGRSGYFTTMVAVEGQYGTTAASPARVKVWFDGVLAYNQTIVGLTKIKVPFNRARNSRVEITLDQSIASAVRISRTAWYTWNDPDTRMIDDPLIPPQSRLCAVMDSWGAYPPATTNGGVDGHQFPNSLASFTNAGSLVDVSVAGTTMQWAVGQFASSLATANCDYVVVDQQINDYATFTQSQWQAQLDAFTSQALADGVTPIFLRSLETQVLGQSQTLVTYDEHLMANHPTQITETLSNAYPRTYTSGTLPAASLSNKGQVVMLDDGVGNLSCQVSNGTAWTACSPAIPPSPFDATFVSLVDEFAGGLNSCAGTGSIGALGWGCHNIGAAPTVSGAAGVYPNIGVLLVRTTAVQGQGGTIALDPGSSSILGNNLVTTANWEQRFIFKLSSTANVRVRIGFLPPGNSVAEPTDGIWLRYDTTTTGACGANASGGCADTNFQFETRKASVSTVVASIAADTNWHRVRIRSTAAGTILFSLDGGTESSISTNVPTASTTPATLIVTDTTATKDLDIDRFAFQWTGLTR